MSKLNLSELTKNNFVTEFNPPIEKLIASGLIQRPNVNGLYSVETKTIKNYHRNTILGQGRADFSTSLEGLSATQRVDLYCFYYFQMHFTSSFLLFSSEQAFIESAISGKDVYFVDIGCGPFTSGYAFNTWLSKLENKNFKTCNYIGVDTSQAMLDKAKKIFNNLGVNKYDSSVFHTDKNFIADGLHSMINNSSDTIFIINYSYLFASLSLNVDDFVSFTNTILTKFCNKNGGKLIVLQQNPEYSSLNLKWHSYKQKLTTLQTKENYPKSIAIQFDDVLGSCNWASPNLNIMCDLIKSF